MSIETMSGQVLDDAINGIGSVAPKVLIIDDDDDLSTLLSSVAETNEFQVSRCTTPRELRNTYRRDLSVIVIDLLMPQMDGVEVLRFLAEQNCQAGIILVSSMDRKILLAAENLAEGRKLNLIGSLQKPFSDKEFTALLNKGRSSASARKLHQHPIKNSMQQLPSYDELVVMFQPKINMDSLDFCSVEALTRWRHPEKGLLGPMFFIPAAEESGRIDDLTYAILQHTLAQCNKWFKNGLILEVSVNISTRTLSDLKFPDRLNKMVQSYQINPGQLILEVTESWLSDDPVACLDSLTRLTLKGFRTSVDDFGTGYSSISQLSRVPFSELKIDRSFVKDAPTDEQARRILKSSIDLGHHLNLNVVAEGIETQEQWNLASELGCDQCQGFFISRPLRGERTLDWLERWQSMQGYHHQESLQLL